MKAKDSLQPQISISFANIIWCSNGICKNVSFPGFLRYPHLTPIFPHANLFSHSRSTPFPGLFLLWFHSTRRWIVWMRTEYHFWTHLEHPLLLSLLKEILLSKVRFCSTTLFYFLWINRETAPPEESPVISISLEQRLTYTYGSILPNNQTLFCGQPTLSSTDFSSRPSPRSALPCLRRIQFETNPFVNLGSIFFLAIYFFYTPSTWPPG